MKKHWIVDIVWYHPYPKQYQYRIEANALPTGVKRALAMFRKEEKGRRIKELTIKVKEYANTYSTNPILPQLQEV